MEGNEQPTPASFVNETVIQCQERQVRFQILKGNIPIYYQFWRLPSSKQTKVWLLFRCSTVSSGYFDISEYCYCLWTNDCHSSYLSIFMIHLSIYLSVYLSFYLSIYLFIYQSIHLSIYLFFCLSIFLSIHITLHLSFIGHFNLSILCLQNVSLYICFYLFYFLYSSSKSCWYFICYRILFIHLSYHMYLSTLIHINCFHLWAFAMFLVFFQV